MVKNQKSLTFVTESCQHMRSIEPWKRHKHKESLFLRDHRFLRYPVLHVDRHSMYRLSVLTVGKTAAAWRNGAYMGATKYVIDRDSPARFIPSIHPLLQKTHSHPLEWLSLYITSFHSEFHRTTITMGHFSFLPIFFLDSRMVSNVGPSDGVVGDRENDLNERQRGRTQKEHRTIKKMENNELGYVESVEKEKLKSRNGRHGHQVNYNRCDARRTQWNASVRRVIGNVTALIFFLWRWQMNLTLLFD